MDRKFTYFLWVAFQHVVYQLARMALLLTSHVLHRRLVRTSKNLSARQSGLSSAHKLTSDYDRAAIRLWVRELASALALHLLLPDLLNVPLVARAEFLLSLEGTRGWISLNLVLIDRCLLERSSSI